MPNKDSVNKDDLVARIRKSSSAEKRLVGKIIGQIKQARKKAKTHLNINEKQLRVHLDKMIKSWEETKIQKIVDQFLTEIKTSLQRKENVLLWGYFSLEVYRMLNKEKSWIRFHASPKLIREINPSIQKKIYCSKHQLAREEHKTNNCCDKSQGIKAYSNCSQFRELQKQIRECSHCNLN